jgi:hypothetical protein
MHHVLPVRSCAHEEQMHRMAGSLSISAVPCLVTSLPSNMVAAVLLIPFMSLLCVLLGAEPLVPAMGVCHRAMEDS